MKERTIIDYKGNEKKITCLGCERENGVISLGNIVKSEFFDTHQDYKIPIPGFLIVSSRRHIQSIDEFTDDEQSDFIKLICRLRAAQRKVLGIDVIYLIQEEDTVHHFHTWLFPRFAWMEEKFGRKIQSVRPIMEYAMENMKTESHIQEVEHATEKLKQFVYNSMIAGV